MRYVVFSLLEQSYSETGEFTTLAEAQQALRGAGRIESQEGGRSTVVFDNTTASGGVVPKDVGEVPPIQPIDSVPVEVRFTPTLISRIKVFFGFGG